MIKTNKKLMLSELGLKGIWHGEFEEEGPKEIYTKDEEVPDDAYMKNTLVGQVLEPLSNQEIQSIIEKFDYTQAQKNKELNEIRRQRNKKLAESDYIIQRDIEQKRLAITPKLSNSEIKTWLSYRQKLRDFPKVVDVNNVVWPTKPSGG